jgi:hypothetical protein
MAANAAHAKRIFVFFIIVCLNCSRFYFHFITNEGTKVTICLSINEQQARRFVHFCKYAQKKLLQKPFLPISTETKAAAEGRKKRGMPLVSAHKHRWNRLF